MRIRGGASAEGPRAQHHQPRTRGEDAVELRSRQVEIEQAEPVYERYPGWEEDVTGCRRFEDLPDNARSYIERIESLVEVPVALISVGAARDATISRAESFGPR